MLNQRLGLPSKYEAFYPIFPSSSGVCFHEAQFEVTFIDTIEEEFIDNTMTHYFTIDQGTADRFDIKPRNVYLLVDEDAGDVALGADFKNGGRWRVEFEFDPEEAAEINGDPVGQLRKLLEHEYEVLVEYENGPK